jgi:hypothetical protein
LEEVEQKKLEWLSKKIALLDDEPSSEIISERMTVVEAAIEEIEV